MNTTSPDLLRLLDSGISAARSSAASFIRAGADAAAGAATPFADLLAKAQKGELHTGLPVEIDRDAGVTLDQDQLARLSRAADAAEAAGLHTAAVLIDGMSLALDVHTRTITSQLDLTAGVVTGIDGIVQAPGATGAAGNAGASTGLVRLPGATASGGMSTTANASVNALLASLQRDSAPTSSGSVS